LHKKLLRPWTQTLLLRYTMVPNTSRKN